MGRRRRRGKRLSSTKAWPILVLFAAVFWAREFLGLDENESLSTQIDELSMSALLFALLLIPFALIWLALKTRRRMKDRKEEKSSKQSDFD